MIIYEKFLGEHGRTQAFGPFTPEQLETIRTVLPEAAASFLAQEGRASYARGFFATVYPPDCDGVLPAWGIKGKKNAVFLRSAFGACLYAAKDKYYYLDPILGRVILLHDDLYLILNYSLRLEVILEHGFFFNHYARHVTAGEQLLPEQILGFAPALPLGGSLETSHVDVVDMKAHLLLLAQLMGGKARRIRG